MTAPPDEPPTGDHGGDPPDRRRAAEPTDGEVDAMFASMTASWSRPDAGDPSRDAHDPDLHDPDPRDPDPREPDPRDPDREDRDRDDRAPREGAGPVVVDAEIVSVRQEPHPEGPKYPGGAPPEEDEGHYEPPEPPPVPTLAPATLGSLTLIALGVALVLVPGLIGLSSSVGFALGLIVISGGLTWLLSRLRSAPPPDSGWHDGAQI